MTTTLISPSSARTARIGSQGCRRRTARVTAYSFPTLCSSWTATSQGGAPALCIQRAAVYRNSASLPHRRKPSTARSDADQIALVGNRPPIENLPEGVREAHVSS